MQQVEVLTLVLMQAFNLNIKESVSRYLNTGTRFNKLHQTHFVRQLDVTILLTKLRVVGVFFQVNQLIEVVGPLFFQRFIQQRGKCRVALLNPATRSNPVSDVMEFVRPELMIFREQILHHQIGVQRRHAVNRKAADHAHVGHTHLFVVHHRQLRPNFSVTRPGFIDQLLKAVVNLFDDLHMARQ